jgi:hypothetical protein
MAGWLHPTLAAARNSPAARMFCLSFIEFLSTWNNPGNY